MYFFLTRNAMASSIVVYFSNLKNKTSLVVNSASHNHLYLYTKSVCSIKILSSWMLDLGIIKDDRSDFDIEKNKD